MMNADRLIAFLRLIDCPRSLLIPGYAVAGFSYATHGFTDDFSITQLIMVWLSVFLGMGALTVLNQIRDRHDDLLRHPDYPLPTGEISLKSAMICLAILTILAGVCAVQLPPLAFGVACIAVSLGGQQIFLPHSLSFVRTFMKTIAHMVVVIFGAVSARGDMDLPFLVWLMFPVILFYVPVCYQILHDPDTPRSYFWHRVLLVLSLPLLLISGIQNVFSGNWTCAGLWALFALHTYTTFYLIRRLPEASAKGPGDWMPDALLRNIVFLQAFWVAASGAHCYWVVLVLLAWPVTGYLSRQLKPEG